MKKLFIFTLITFLSASCVQKAYEQTVTLTLDVSDCKDIKTVGLRGQGTPLSWNKDIEMTPIVKDSLYTVTIKALTGYKFAEIKFVVNDTFELEDKDNRKVFFDEDRVTEYHAKFNIENHLNTK